MATRKRAWAVVRPFFVLAVGLFIVACGDGQESVQQPSQAPTQETVSPTPQAFQTPAGFREIGPEAIWNPVDSEAALVRLQGDCIRKKFECVEAIMQEAGASPEAIEFYRVTQWFMTDFRETGRVDVVSILDPWRANSVGDYALVNGSPAIVYVEEEGRFVLIDTSDPDYGTLVALYPDLLLWSSDNLFESHEESPRGGESLIFQFFLNNGCHACVTGYFARVAFDFFPDGSLWGPRFLGICEGSGPYATPVAESVAPCPATDVPQIGVITGRPQS